MADVLLAVIDDSFWLVHGETHFDDLLCNELDSKVTVEFVPCANMAEMRALRERHGEAPEEEPWAINPAIIRRIRGQLRTQSVNFGPWSAMLDAAAQDAIDTSVERLRDDPERRLSLRQFSPAEPPAGLADLQRLRGTLLAGALTRSGADGASLDHETQVSEAPADADRIDLVTTNPASKGGE